MSGVHVLAHRIPKTIHYCWLSGEAKPDVIASCIDSWRRHMPDYELVCWTREAFDIESVPWVKGAIEARKWAFAADYIRLHALYHHGGIYLDSDVRVFKSFDPFLNHQAFSSIEFHPEMFHESIRRGSYAGLGVEAAVLAAEPHHPWMKGGLALYTGREFVNDPRFYNELITSGMLADLLARDFGFTYQPVYQVLKDDIHLYPPDVFSRTGSDNPVRYSSHLCAGSWREPVKRAWAITAARAVLRRIGLR